MKFHKQIKLEGHTQAEIKETLESKGLKFRRMRQEYSWIEKLELTNGFTKVQFLIEDHLLEIRGNGDYDVWSWALRMPTYFKHFYSYMNIVIRKVYIKISKKYVCGCSIYPLKLYSGINFSHLKS